jgi:hypothetical protein
LLKQFLTGFKVKQEDPTMEVGMPISDTYYLEDSKVWELDSLMKIITSSFIADLINRQISEQKIAQELSNIGKQLRAEQI